MVKNIIFLHNFVKIKDPSGFNRRMDNLYTNPVLPRRYTTLNLETSLIKASIPSRFKPEISLT